MINMINSNEYVNDNEQPSGGNGGEPNASNGNENSNANNKKDSEESDDTNNEENNESNSENVPNPDIIDSNEDISEEDVPINQLKA